MQPFPMLDRKYQPGTVIIQCLVTNGVSVQSLTIVASIWTTAMAVNQTVIVIEILEELLQTMTFLARSLS